MIIISGSSYKSEAPFHENYFAEATAVIKAVTGNIASTWARRFSSATRNRHDGGSIGKKHRTVTRTAWGTPARETNYLTQNIDLMPLIIAWRHFDACHFTTADDDRASREHRNRLASSIPCIALINRVNAQQLHIAIFILFTPVLQKYLA